MGLPIGQVGVETAGLKLLRLPASIVDIIDRQRRQVRAASRHQSVVEHAQFMAGDGQRPAVRDHVVHRQDQHVVVRRHPNDAERRERTTRHIERTAQQFLPQPTGFGVTLVRLKAAKIDDVAGCFGALQHFEPGASAGFDDAGTESLVALHQRLDRLPQTIDIEHAAKPEAAADIIAGLAGVDPLQEPQPLLGGRGGDPRGTGKPA